MQNNNIEDLETLLDKIANSIGLYIVKVTFLSLRNHLIEVKIDKIDGTSIMLSDCTLYSSQLKNYEAEISKILGSSEYSFDVSSPGIERPLVKLADYEKFKDNVVLLKFKVKLENKKKIQGTLIGVEAEKIKIESKGILFSIDYDNIASANIVMTEELFRKLLSK